jgi:hypothetical protein
MSLLGKILALLNVLGAVGLVAVAALDYGKRQTWTYAYFQHELVLNGLPVSEKEIDAENVPIVDRYGEDTLRELFSPVGGREVPTQMKEVERLKNELDGKLNACGDDKVKRTYLLARILLPMTTTIVERDRLLACQTQLASPEKAAAFKNRLLQAWKQALNLDDAKAERPRSLAQVFRIAFHTLPGGSAEEFVTEFLRKDIPDDRVKAAQLSFDTLFDEALSSQLAKLQDRYNALFGLALASPPAEAGPKPELAGQKAAIASLLFGLCPFLAEEAILTDPAREAEKNQLLQAQANNQNYQQLLLDSAPFKQAFQRYATVVGLRASVPPVMERAAVLRQLAAAVAGSRIQEQQQFVSDHQFLIDQIRGQLALVQYQRNLIRENLEKITLSSEVVKQRQAEIKEVEAELARARETTQAEINQLRQLSNTVLQLRVKIRDAIQANEKGEVRVRELEKQIRDLEK